MSSWDAAKFIEKTGLEPLESSEARSKISWWVNSRSEHAPLLWRTILGSSDSRSFHYGAERAIEEAFYTRWKLFKLPKIERQPVKVIPGTSAPGAAYVPPAVIPAAEEVRPKTWFEVKIVDEFGKPIDGLDVVFSQGSRQEKLATNGAGVVRWEDVEGPSFASVKVANLASLREALKPRYAKPGERKMPDGADVTKVMLGIDEPGKSLTSEFPGVLVVAKPLTRVRLVGMHFDTNKCFLREPAMRGIRKVVSVYKANPTGKLLIVGHTDTTGDDAYNLDLSLERAEAVKAYLADDVAAWEAWFGEGKPGQKRWGTSEIKHMIQALPCEQTVKGFQQWSNDTRGTALVVDGAAGPKTRTALIEAYMALDGTTLPKSIEVAVHGCGEFFPVANAGDQFGKDGVSADEDRRVELFCFDDDIQPPVPGKKAKKGEVEYQQWNKQVTTELDVSVAAGDGEFVLTVVDEEEKPLAGRKVRVVQNGETLFEGQLDGLGQAKITGNDPTQPCDVFVEGLAAMTLSGGPPDDVSDAESMDDAEGLEDGGGDAEAFAPGGGVLAAGPKPASDPDIDPDDDDVCGAAVPVEPFIGSAMPYEVQKGDRMETIAAPYGLTGKELGEFRGDLPSNKKNVERLASGDINLIKPGEIILVPAPEED